MSPKKGENRDPRNHWEPKTEADFAQLDDFQKWLREVAKPQFEDVVLIVQRNGKA